MMKTLCHLSLESLKVSKLDGYDHPIAPPLQRSSTFLPGVRVVVWPRRRKRPLSRTWVSRDWPLPPPPPSLALGGLVLTRFPPGLLRFSPASFLLLACWQSPGQAEEHRGGVRGANNLSFIHKHDFLYKSQVKRLLKYPNSNLRLMKQKRESLLRENNVSRSQSLFQ